MFFYKKLRSFAVPDDIFLEEIKSRNNKIWFTAENSENYELNFVRNKENANFFLSRLKNFPIVCKFIEQHIPEAVIPNSYITKCSPGYAMEKHIDANRKTAIIIPLGSNKGILNYYVKDFNISKCFYEGPTLSRVDTIHSAVNNSDQVRYSITVEIPGSYFRNYFKYH